MTSVLFVILKLKMGKSLPQQLECIAEADGEATHTKELFLYDTSVRDLGFLQQQSMPWFLRTEKTSVWIAPELQ